MIASKTFKPAEEHGSLVSAVSSANQWVAETSARVINIETLVHTYGGHMEPVNTREVGIRVWYETVNT